MQLMEFLAIFFCGAFFGAAVYVSIVQHPAAMKAGVPIAQTFFPLMYGLAAPMQITCALGGTVAGLIQWYLSDDFLWAIGAIFLVMVIPYTLVVLRPINDQLLNPDVQRTTSETENLLKQWASRHWIRSIAGGLSFATYLWASIDA